MPNRINASSFVSMPGLKMIVVDANSEGVTPGDEAIGYELELACNEAAERPVKKKVCAGGN